MHKSFEILKVMLGYFQAAITLVVLISCFLAVAKLVAPFGEAIGICSVFLLTVLAISEDKRWGLSMFGGIALCWVSFPVTTHFGLAAGMSFWLTGAILWTVCAVNAFTPLARTFANIRP